MSLCQLRICYGKNRQPCIGRLALWHRHRPACRADLSNRHRAREQSERAGGSGHHQVWLDTSRVIRV